MYVLAWISTDWNPSNAGFGKAAMEAHPDFGRCNGDIGGHVDEIAKDLRRRVMKVIPAAAAYGLDKKKTTWNE